MKWMLAFLVLGLAVSPAFADTVTDNFESYTLGTFPSPTWQDVGTVFTPPGQTLPSAQVVQTTDAFGNSTQALSILDQVTLSRGIFATVPVSTTYALAADIRVDRYSDHPPGLGTAENWAMQLTFAEAGVDNFAFTPQAGIYASSLTGGWRLFVIGGPGADIDLGVPAAVGKWYKVELDFNALSSTFHSRIIDAKTGAVLVDRFDTIAGLTPADAQYNSIAFFGGETNPDTQVADLAMVDNVNISSTPVPEPSSLALLGGGLGFIVSRAKRGRA